MEWYYMNQQILYINSFRSSDAYMSVNLIVTGSDDILYIIQCMLLIIPDEIKVKLC